MGCFFKDNLIFLVCKNTHNVDQFFPIKIVPDRFCHLVGCSGIVSAVYNKKRLFIDNRKSSLPACVEKTVLPLFHGSSPAKSVQFFKGV